MRLYRPETLKDVNQFSYGYDFEKHSPVYVNTSYGFGEPLGQLERVTPENNTMQEAAKQGYWRLK